MEKINELNFRTRSISQNATETVAELQIFDEPPLHQLFSAEANKFWLASMFSLNRSRQNQDGNFAWQAVEHYYAAYYAVHYLLRVSGISLTNLDASAVSVIQRSTMGILQPATMPAGLCILRYDPNTSTLFLHKDIKKSPGGSHKDAWKLWDELVVKMIQQAQSDVVEYSMTSLQLNEHRSFIVKSTGNYNPPEVRGEINYQFKGGVWKFERNAAKSINELQAFITQPASSPVKSPVTVRSLMANNKIIIELAQLIFEHTAKVYPKSICSSIANQYASYL